MATEALAWAGSPTATDAVDGSQAYNMGVLFSVDEDDTPCPGVEWRVPDSVANPQGGPHAISIWEDVSGTRIAYEEITPAAFVGTEHTFTFTSPPTLDSGIDYVAAIYTNHYVFSSGSPAGTTSPSGRITAGAGRLAAYNSGAATAPKPTDTSGLTFYISPVVDLGGTPETGVLAATLPALAAAGAGEVTAAGALASALPPLQASASAAVLASGALAAALPPLQLAATADVEQEAATGTLSATLPALRAVLRGVVPTADVGLVGAYRGLISDLRGYLVAAGAPLRVIEDVAAPVDSGDVVIGPPTWIWDGMCDPDQPDSATFEVYLVESLGERAVENLLTNLPALLSAVAKLGDESIVTDCRPAAFPSGTSDLPAYQITVETTF